MIPHSDDEGAQGSTSHWGSASGTRASTSSDRTPSTPSSSLTTSFSAGDKGKAKAVEGDAQAEPAPAAGQDPAHATPATDSSQESNPGVDQARQDLEFLANLAPAQAERLVDLDPTPIHHLLTTTKIMRAISMLTSACSLMQEANSISSDRSASTGGVPSACYHDIVELLTSVLSDVAQSNPSMRSNPKPVAVHHLELARAKLSLPLQNAVPPPAAVTDHVEGVFLDMMGRTIGLDMRPASPQPPSELSLVFAENARLALATLRPPGLFPPRSDVSIPSSNRMHSRADTPCRGPSPISKLPSELLLSVLQFAHSAAAEPSISEVLSPSHGTTVTEYHNGRPRRSNRDAHGNPVNGVSGSKGAAQRFTLALARVCKAWVEPARTVALRHLYLPQGHQIAELLATLNTSPSLKHSAPSIQAISATLAPPGSNESASNGGGTVSVSRLLVRAGVGRIARAAATPVTFGGRPGSSREGSSGTGAAGAGGQGDEGKTPAENWSQLVEQSPNVRKLKLKIIPSNTRWTGFRHPMMTEFLDAAVLGALSSTPSLRNVNLAFSIDFEELEVIMNGLPNLEILSIRAIDAISGSATVNSTTPHPACKLRHFKLGEVNANDPYQMQGFTSMSDVQLAWLLEPAVARGSLKELDVSVMIDPGAGGGWAPGMPPPLGFGPGANAPPFASSTIADLLVRCGTNLERLVLQDVAGDGVVNPNLAAAPHNSNLDHALASLTSLRELSLQFSYTGPNLLQSLSSMPRLRTLSLSGTPVHTSADLFADQLEHGLRKLEHLTISGQFAGTRGGQGGWNGTGVRRVKQAAKERGLQGAFGG